MDTVDGIVEKDGTSQLEVKEMTSLVYGSAVDVVIIVLEMVVNGNQRRWWCQVIEVKRR